VSALAALLLLAALAGGVKLATVGTTPNSDYDSYIATAQLFSGLPASEHPERILKPLAPLAVALVAPVLGFPQGFVFVAFVFYLAFAAALYALGWAFFRDRFAAVCVALLGALSYPLLRYGVDLYTETGALFLFVLSLYLLLHYAKEPSARLVMANASVIGIALLWKEYSVVAGLAFGLLLLFERNAWKIKIGRLTLLALFSIAPTLLVQVWVYLTYGYTYLDWYVSGGASGFATEFTLTNLVKSTAALLGVAWLFVPLGLHRFASLPQPSRAFLFSVIPATMACFAWGYVSSRLFYVMAPAFLLLAVLGLSRLPRGLQYAGLGVSLAANIIWLYVATS
jgi:hypothetical protein